MTAVCARMASARVIAGGSLNTSSSITGLTVGAAQRNPPVGIVVGRARLVLGSPISDRVGQRQPQQSRRRSAQVLVEGEHGLLFVSVLRQQADPTQLADPGRPLGLGGRELLVNGTGQQAQ